MTPFDMYATMLQPWQQMINLYRAPLSGDVTQDINPVTSWLSPQFEFNFAGNRQLESKVVSQVASYGKQLGVVTDALVELAQGEQGEALKKLQQMQADIEQLKQQHQQQLLAQVKSGLGELQRKDPEALKQLLTEFQP
ncbi:hypothetical protein [Bacterioplanoides sp.]|uniref:hypothetical protein n=1 Tax=Bacterioplanoides sp. TaxID=2066072 RepID=UPI003B5AEE1D